MVISIVCIPRNTNLVDGGDAYFTLSSSPSSPMRLPCALKHREQSGDWQKTWEGCAATGRIGFTCKDDIIPGTPLQNTDSSLEPGRRPRMAV